jgi:hypothetical protein
MVHEFQKRNKFYGQPLVYGYCASKRMSMRNIVILSDRPSIPRQNTSTVQLAVSQPIFGAAVICRPAHARRVLPFVHSPNNFLSEHIHRMLLSNVAVTAEQLTVKYMV